MSVFTEVGRDQLIEFLLLYDLGQLQEYRGISAGIENTNYFVDTDRGRYVLTLFEHQQAEDLRFSLGLMGVLAAAGVPTAEPVAGRDGKTLRRLAGKPAALVMRLSGRAVEHPEINHCRALGAALADFHLAGLNYSSRHENPRGAAWFKATAARVEGQLPDDQAELLRSELAIQRAVDTRGLPQGVIHGDLFRDNALFDGDRLAGVIDLYAACNSNLLYDLAICVNDWCVEAGGMIDPERAAAMVGSYHAKRALTETEQQTWPLMMRRAALRFWLSRLFDKHFPRPGELTRVLDPDHFLTILRRRIEVPETLTALCNRHPAR
ncbi:MAG: homoserine kinase [Gammaproteobacteria bacterium]